MQHSDEHQHCIVISRHGVVLQGEGGRGGVVPVPGELRGAGRGRAAQQDHAAGDGPGGVARPRLLEAVAAAPPAAGQPGAAAASPAPATARQGRASTQGQRVAGPGAGQGGQRAGASRWGYNLYTGLRPIPTRDHHGQEI